MIRASILMNALLAAALMSACARNMNPQKGAHEFADKDEVASEITNGTWCLVEEDAKPFNNDAAVGYRYSPNGSVDLRVLSTDKDAKLNELKSTGTWTFEKNIMTVRDSASGSIFPRKLELVRYAPPENNTALWMRGVAVGEQDCLKSVDLADAAKFSIQCKCDLDRVKSQR